MKAENEVVIKQEEMKKKTIQVRVVGDSPLIVHAWSEKAKKEMLGKQQKKASKAKEVRDTTKEWLHALYVLDRNGNRMEQFPADMDVLDDTASDDEVMEVVQKYRYGFPMCAFKAAMIDGAFRQGLIAKKTTARGAILLRGEYAVIEGIPTPREDMVRIGGMTKVADLRYRPEFKQWSTVLTIEYLENSVSAEQIFQWLEYGGFCEGVGEWRMSRDGSFGAFHPEAV